MSTDYADYEFYGQAPILPPHLSGFGVQVQVLADQDAAVAAVQASHWDAELGHPVATRTTGSSKRERGDAHDPEVGELLAVSRALRKLADKLEKKAGSRMRHLASIRAHHAVIKAARKADEAAMERAAREATTFDVAEMLIKASSAARTAFGPASPGFIPRDVAERAIDAMAGPLTADVPSPRPDPDPVALAMNGADVDVDVELGSDGTVAMVNGEPASPVRFSFIDRQGHATRLTVAADGYVNIYDEATGNLRRGYYA